MMERPCLLALVLPVSLSLSLSLSFALLGAACSSSTYEGPPAQSVTGDDAGDDARTSSNDAQTSQSETGGGETDAIDETPRATACTAPPFVAFTAHVREITVSGSEQPLAGANIGFTSCAGFTLTTDPSGVAATQVTQGIAYSPFFSALGHISAVGAESPAASDADLTVSLPVSSAADIFPGYDKSKPTLAIVLVAKGTTAACKAVDGVTLQVTGHAEATAKYMSAAWPSDRNPTAATSSVGDHVFFTGLAGGLTVKVTGTKAGCTVTTVTSTQTGNFQVVSGLFTIGNAIITD
jgi:hypothetical protein